MARLLWCLLVRLEGFLKEDRSVPWRSFQSSVMKIDCAYVAFSAGHQVVTHAVCLVAISESAFPALTGRISRGY